MDPPYLLLQTVLVPIVFAGICYIASYRLGRAAGWLAFLSIAYTTTLVLSSAQQIYSTGSQITETYVWAPTAGLTFGFLADGLSLPVLVVVNIVLAATTIYSMPYMAKRLASLEGLQAGRGFGLYFMNYLLVCADGASEASTGRLGHGHAHKHPGSPTEG